jgi:ribosomal protein S18 acetylase RimI-like enzyme
MAELSFRISRVSSAEEIATAAALFRAYAEALGIDLSFQDFEGELASLPGKYARPKGELLLARGNGGEPLGCVAMRPMSEDGCCEMKRLYVAPAARGLGLGLALVEAIITAAHRAGYREMRLDTLPTMATALSLYERQGFVRIAPYYDTPVVGTVFMAKQL